MEMNFFQSCGMPLTPKILGTNADGSKNGADAEIVVFKKRQRSPNIHFGAVNL